MRILLLSADHAGQEEYVLSQKERRYLMKVLRLAPGAAITATSSKACARDARTRT